MGSVPVNSTGSIGFVVPQLSHGGAERQTALLIERLVTDHGIRPWVFSMSGSTEPFGPQIRRLGCELLSWNRQGGYEIARLLAIRRQVQARRTRLVHTINYEATAYTGLALTGIRGVRILPSIRNSEYQSRGLKGRLMRATLRTSPRIIVNSYQGADFLRSRFGVHNHQLQVIPNAVAPACVRNGMREEVRRRLGIPENSEVVVYIGKNTRQKDVPLLQIIAARLLEARGSVWFVMVGYGMDSPAISRWARQWNGRVLAMGPQDDVSPLLAAGDALLLTSRAEGCPNAVMEAMMFGLPVVATDAGDCARLIDHATDGFVFPRGDAKSGCAALVKLLDNPPLRRALGERARAKMLRQYTPSAMVGATLGVYTELLNGMHA